MASNPETPRKASTHNGDEQLISALSRELVTRVAPEELDLFDELLADYYHNPKPPDLTRTDPDSPLGSGIGSIMVAVTPAAAATSTAAVQFVQASLQATGSADAAQVRQDLQTRLDPNNKPQAPLLTQEQLAGLREITLKTAAQYGMNRVQAEQLTNAILVSLVLGPTAGTSVSKPVTILFLAANPGQTDRLALDREIRGIDSVLRVSALRDHFEMEQHWAVHLTDLQSLLLRYQPDIVHFSGHGSSAGRLMLDTDEGEPYEIPIPALSNLFRLFRDSVRCVVLNACFSELQAQAIAEHIMCVVGMSSKVDDASSISFAAAFYQALAYGKAVQTAFELGLGQLALERSPSSAVPQLLVRDEDARQLRFA